MQKTITRAVVSIEALIDHIGKLTAWLALAMISLVAVNVLLRYAFSLGSVWAQELEWHLLAALILLGMSHALLRGDNVRVDLFYVRYSTRARFVVDVVSVLLIMVALCVRARVSWWLRRCSPGWSSNKWVVCTAIGLSRKTGSEVGSSPFISR